MGRSALWRAFAVSIAIVLNPNARGVRHEFEERARRLERITRAHGRVYATRTLDELRTAVAELMADPPEFVVTDGGDGTLHWVLNEARRHVPSVANVPPLLPTNGGTIDFVARKVGVKGNAESIVRELVKKLDRGSRPSIVEIDSLVLEGKELNEDGALVEFSRLGFALAAGGIGQRFFSKYYAERELGRGAIVRVVAKAVASRLAGQLRLPLPERFLTYGRDVFEPTHASVAIDGDEVPGVRHGAIHAGSIDVSLGGVFRVFPLARDRGRVHFQAGEIVPSEIIRALPALARGGAIPSERLREVAGEEMRIAALGDESLAPIIDGEWFPGLRELVVRPGPRIKVPRIRA
jgi:diacylglycerol kinase family enzyme